MLKLPAGFANSGKNILYQGGPGPAGRGGPAPSWASVEAASVLGGGVFTVAIMFPKS